MHKLIVVAALAVGAVPAVCMAQQSEEIARPEVKAGDRWTYRSVDLWNGRDIGGSVTTVVNVTPRAIQTINVRRGTDKEVDETWTPEWDAVNTAEGGIYDPDDGAFKFPLRIGATWPVAYQLRRTAMDVYQRTFAGEAKVVGWETVSVPAGNFRALKIIIDGRFERVGAAFAVTTYVWYVPEVKRWVKFRWEGWSLQGKRELNDGWQYELTDYKVQ